jgi:glycosyltransferase involved in cell wall biosynthesis
VDVVILQASRIERWKGQDIVLHALGALKDLPHWRFWLAGGPQRGSEVPYYDELRALAGALGIAHRVAFLGERADVPALMQAADIYCQANRAPEGFGLSFLEAGYWGLPTVASHLGAAGDAVDPSTALLVPPENVQALATALRTLISDPARRQALATEAHAKTIEQCDPCRQLERLWRLLADVLSGSTSGDENFACSGGRS